MKEIILIGLIVLVLVSGCNVSYKYIDENGKCKYKVAERFCEDMGLGFKGIKIWMNHVFVDCYYGDYVVEYTLIVKDCIEREKQVEDLCSLKEIDIKELCGNNERNKRDMD